MAARQGPNFTNAIAHLQQARDDVQTQFHRIEILPAVQLSEIMEQLVQIRATLARMENKMDNQ